MEKDSENDACLGENDMPDVIQWYTVPEQYDKDDKWYLSVMSAFYDYRIGKQQQENRSLAAYQIEKNPESQPKFTCVYFYDNLTYTATVEGYFYTSYIFYCPMFKLKRFKHAKRISRDQIPEAVSLIRNDTFNEEVINWTIPVVNLYRRKIDRFSMISDQNGSLSIPVDNARKLAICVGIMFGYQPWLTVLQFIEFHRMQGVEKFLFFYSSMHESIKEIFEWYKVNVPGLIETIYWLPPHFTCDHEYRCQLLRDNYCSYTLMHKYKYVANSDYDELFYPADIENKTLLDLLDEIDDETRGSFTFR
uniref:Glycosyltransferase family 92 protein n=1 Tax=Romanomermis culicivorax TaxID=13658 RepID=A0A915KJ47_ROMCU